MRHSRILNSSFFKRGAAGQAVTEYLLLLFIISGMFMFVYKWLSSSGLAQKLAKPLQRDFAAAYKYGDSKVKGYDEDGGPQKHPRIVSSGNFRLFFNPRRR